MPQALSNPDPYYWIRQVQEADQTRMALGQRGGYKPQELTDMIGANFEAQQKQMLAQEGINLQKRELNERRYEFEKQNALSQAQFEENKRQFEESKRQFEAEQKRLKSLQEQQMWSGIGSLVTSLATAYLGSSNDGVSVNNAGGGGIGASYSISTVICTELNRQGLLPDDIYRLDSEYGRRIDPEAHAGYLMWGELVARLMKRSRVFTMLVYPFCTAWAYEMAHRVKPEVRGNILGRLMCAVGVPACKLLYRITRRPEVAHG